MKPCNVYVILLSLILLFSCNKQTPEPILKIGEKYQCFYDEHDTVNPPNYLYLQFVNKDDVLHAYSELSPELVIIKKGNEYVHSADYTLNGDSIVIINALSTFEGIIRNDTIFFTVKNYANFTPEIYRRYYKLYK